MRVMSRVAVAVALGVFAAAPLAAQATFSLAAGASLPIDAPNTEMGYNAIVGVGFKPPIAPNGARVEGMFNSFEGKNNSGNLRVLAAIANVTLSTVPAAGAAVPMLYGIGGLGLYNSRADLPAPFADVTQTDLGFNIGAGLNVPLTGFGTFIEARFHYVTDSKMKFVPITVGIKF
jgi:hypothetical protein